MKIVQLLPELNEGGVERGTMELSRELLKRGYESVVISAGGKLQEQIERDGGIHITFDLCSKNIFSAPLRMIKLRKILKSLEPDIIHARSRVPAWLAYIANKKLHIPFVTTVHGFNSVSPYSEVMTKGDRVICVSGAIKSYIEKHYQVADEKITVIPRGIDLEKFNPKNIDTEFIRLFTEEYALNDKFIVTAVGRITQLKDLETFIRAIALLKQSHANVVGLIVGGVREDKEDYFHSLEVLVNELGLGDNIIFTGSQSKVAEIYTLSDVVVSSSKKPESFGRSVAEALALGTPVAATDHGGVLDIIVEGENGFFYPVGDSDLLANCIDRCSHLEFDGYRYICEHFSLDQMVDKTLKLYEGVLRIKVLQFIASKGWGGAEKSFVELCNTLPQSIQIEVVLFKENQIEERLNPHIKIYRLSSHSSRYNPFLYLEFLKLIKKNRPDIIHTHSAKASEIIYNLNKLVSVKQVATKRNPRERNIFNKIDYVTAVSKNVARSIDNDNVALIYNGLIQEATMPEQNLNSIFTLVAVGRLDRIKGFDILIREVAKLNFPFHLNIVGDGVERENLDELIIDLGLSEKVSLLGYREDIPSLIAKANLVIISSHSEGFGRVVIETLLYGKLIISTKVGISMEILPEELLINDFEIAQKIDAIFNNEQHYNTLFIQLKKERTKEFLLKNTIQKYMEVYKGVLNR